MSSTPVTPSGSSAMPLADAPFATLAQYIRRHALAMPHQSALVQGGQTLDYAALDALMDRVAVGLQRDGLGPGDAIAICATMSIPYAAIFLGALRAGVAVAPLAPGSGADGLGRMVRDAQAQWVFADAPGDAALGPVTGDAPSRMPITASVHDLPAPLEDWLGTAGVVPRAVAITPEMPFNIIYSSGTTGEPKGIVQSHGMRWTHICRGAAYGYGPGTATIVSTPLYSNTTLVVFCPTLALGGTAVLMPRFDALGFLELAQTHHATHAMLVPVQYQRLMAHPQFDRFDLSRFRVKFSTSAPFGAMLKKDVLRRWPGGLVEFYGMTEGGGTCILEAHHRPDKLHTVGRPATGHDIRLIDDNGFEVGPGQAGEVVGHSAGMMTAYHGQPEKTREAEWFDPFGKRFIRTGDIGRFDEDGFLILLDRKKDMVISGGFNVYPSDLEAVLRAHPAVADVAVVGVPSERWGETPVAFVVPGDGLQPSAVELLHWANAQLGKTQRLADLRLCVELPRSAIGKILKRELRAQYQTDPRAPP
ncbi:MAG: class I adenylate-forming enzyme family protein [Burkholderiaceae bacterium]